MTVAARYATQVTTSPFLASSVASTVRVEYVVHPPRNPTTRSGRSSGTRGPTCSVSGSKAPMANEPERFTTRVSHGNPLVAIG